MTLTGQIIDADSYAPLPGATVELWFGNVMLARVAANGNGVFVIASQSTPDRVTVTSASYLPASFPYAQAVDDSLFALEKKIAEGEEVIVTAVLKKHGWWILPVLFLLLTQKRRA